MDRDSPLGPKYVLDYWDSQNFDLAALGKSRIDPSVRIRWEVLYAMVGERFAHLQEIATGFGHSIVNPGSLYRWVNCWKYNVASCSNQRLFRSLTIHETDGVEAWYQSWENHQKGEVNTS